MQAAAAITSDPPQDIVDLMTGFTVETTPGSAAKVPDFRDHLRPGTTVYVTFLPGSDFADTIATARRLKSEGFNPIPHFPARSIPSKQFLEENLRRLVDDIDLKEALIIAGAVDKPLGEFTDSMQLLGTGLFDKHGITRIGVAGHPEGSPDIPGDAVKRALRWKNDFASRTDADIYVLTQFCFEAKPVIEWDQSLQAEGNILPVVLGIPGLATIKTLLAHAKACGVGPSMRFLSRQARNVAKLMSVSAPDKLLTDLAHYQATDPKCGISGVHMYPLGGLARSAVWSYAVTDGNFTMNKDGSGFDVSAK